MIHCLCVEDHRCGKFRNGKFPCRGTGKERLEFMEMQEPLGLQAARAFIGMGARVFPAFASKTDEKIPLVKDWPNVAVGSLDGGGEGVLKEWYSRYPYAWVGISCCADSFVCLDVDGSEGVQGLRELVGREDFWTPGAMVARTPGRDAGLHVYWRWPSWLDGTFSSAKLRVGERGEIDLRGNRHFVLAAGARRTVGSYEILEEPSGLAAYPPRGLVDYILANAEVTAGGSYGGSGMEEVSEAEAWAYAPLVEGRKNCLAGLLWHKAIRGGSYEEVLDLGMRFSEEVCEPPLSEELVEKKARYTYDRASKRREESRIVAARQVDRVKNRGMRFGELIV